MKTDELIVKINQPQSVNDEELESWTRQLRDELIDSEDVREALIPPSPAAPDGAKVVEPFSLGALLLTLAASGGALTSVLGLIKNWMDSDKRRSVKVKFGKNEIEVKNISRKELDSIIHEWKNRIAGGKEDA